MKRDDFLSLLLIAIFAPFIALPAQAVHAGMSSYCQQPPYVIQNAIPNILFVESASKNLNRFAYYDGFLDPGIIPTTDNLCITDNCTKFTRPGTYPAYKYTGFFDPDYWYTYSAAGGGKFTRSNAKSAGRPAGGWDGNFLNWLTMRRYDILTKVLVGKKRAADDWEGQGAADNSAGLWKKIANAQNYIDNTVGTGTVTFKFNVESGGQTSEFTLSDGGSGTFKVKVAPVTGEKATGVFQDVFPQARAGIAQASGDGMRVWSLIDFSWVQADINQIINTPSSQLGNQGLANQLWGISGYFAYTTNINNWSPAPDADSSYGFPASSKDPLRYGGSGPYYGCAQNYIIYITDGDPSGDGNIPDQLKNYAANTGSPFNCGGTGSTLPDTCQGTTAQGVSWPPYSFPAGTGNVSGLEDVALWAHTTDLRSPAIGTNDIWGKQNLTIYVVNAFGSASTYLKYVAINGGFDDLGSGIPDHRSTWDKGGSGVPYNYYEARDQDQLQRALTEAVNSILKRATSGTAASVLASAEGSGANLLQAVFYPRRRFSNDIIMWPGTLQNLWYYVDPFFGNATIREETVNDGKLNLQTDYIVRFVYDNNSQTTKVLRWRDVNGDGKTLVAQDNVTFEDMDSLWEAGKILYYMNPTDRDIKTTTDGSTFTPFTEGNAPALAGHLLPDAGQDAAGIVRYTLGYDNSANPALRNRTVEVGTDNNVWKLGDIITSTPRVVSGIPLNKYYETYSDPTYGPASDNNTFTGRTTYKNRGMVFAGGNDGILHAFNLGKLEVKWVGQSGQIEKARLTNVDNVSLGQEKWGFIPRNVLPYLKYLSDNNYCHLNYVDLSPYIFDASIGSPGTSYLPAATRTADSWRTILIGGMRTGGACSDSCSTAECVQTPGAGKGFSSYFAIDVTDPRAPTLLWEFSDPNLGFSTTGPAIVRINGFNGTTNWRDKSLNGEWYVVFGSGPTGPIDNSYQFLGKSGQPLRIFVRNLKTGSEVQTINTTIDRAFAGSILNASADYNLDYQDDVVYIPYVKRASDGTWTSGGVGRLVPRVSTTSSSVTWAWSRVIDEIGPVTSAVAHLQNNTTGNAWLYFGTGRYYYDHPPGLSSPADPDIDDPENRRNLFGIKEQCFHVSFGTGYFDNTCSDTSILTYGQLDDVTDVGDVKSPDVTKQFDYKGYRVSLEEPGPYTYDTTRNFYAERVITDPLASANGIVYFTTFKPYGDYCAIGGKGFLWALRYNTGGAPLDAVMKGKGLLQVSTAAIEEIDLSTAFKKAPGESDDGLHKGGRRTASIEGVPPIQQGLTILSQPPPLKRMLHMKER